MSEPAAAHRWTARLEPEVLAERTAALLREGDLDGERAIFVHDLDRLTERVGLLRAAFPDSALHGIAVKANPLVSVLRAVVDAGGGLECASLEEVELCLAAGCAPDRIIFDSPAKTVEELKFALDRRIHLNLDNFQELDRVRALEPDGSGHIGIRVNPQVGGGRIAMTSVAGRVSKFGVPLEPNRERLLAAYAGNPWLDGLHVHVGSQGCAMEQLVEAATRVEAFRREAARGRAPITQVDIGGGLPVAYRATDAPPSVDAYAGALREAVPSLFDDGTRLLTEFGRAIHAGCGWAVSRVEYVKPDGAGGDMAVIHLGADAFMRRVYKPDDWHHDFLVLTPDGALKTAPSPRPVTLVGPLCFGGDVLAREAALPSVEAGDLVVVRDCGAYTLSMWSRHCSRGLPKVVGWRADAREVLFRGERPRDVVSFWS